MQDKQISILNKSGYHTIKFLFFLSKIILFLLTQMMPVLLYSLNNINMKNEDLWTSSLKSFEILINEGNTSEDDEHSKYFLGYLNDIVTKLLTMSRYEENMNIRVLALNCINKMAIRIAPNKLIKMQRLVCKQLEKCLNDKKRVCRQIAVEARNRWFLLTTKTNEK
jgi:hypothetical protein